MNQRSLTDVSTHLIGLNNKIMFLNEQGGAIILKLLLHILHSDIIIKIAHI